MAIAERRKVVRRQADRDLLRQYQAMRAAPAQGKAMDPETMNELRRLRRHAIRHNCEVRMAVKISHAAGAGDIWSEHDHPVKGRILDLSLDGCSIFCAHAIDIGQQVSLVLNLHKGRQVHTLGMVRWTKGVPQKNGYATGVQFAKLSDKDLGAVRAFLKEMDETVGL